MLDTLKYVNILETRGYTREQAEAQVSLVRDVMTENFATKQDLKDLKVELKADIAEVKSEITDIKSEIKNLELRLTIKMGTLMSLMSGLIIGVIKFF
jgi:hypothetical protein